MARVYDDFIQETTTSTASPWALQGGANGMQTFSSFMSIGDTTTVEITNGVDRETGLYEYTDDDELTLVTLHNNNSPVSWGAGSKKISCVMTAREFAQLSLARVPAGGRVTLTSGVAIPTTDVTGAPSIHYTPTIGDIIQIHDGTAFVPFQIPELSLTLDADSGHAGYHQAGKIFDLLIFNDSGTVRFGTGPAWSSDTARGTGAGTTELQLVNGIWVPANTITIRYGASGGDTVSVPVSRATCVGWFRATANGITEDSAVKRFIGNSYNRVPRALRRSDPADNWPWSTNSYRQQNNNAANKVEVLRGFDVEPVDITMVATMFTSDTLITGYFGIGVDVTNAKDLSCIGGMINAISTYSTPGTCHYCASPGLGYHALNMVEKGAGSGTQTWYGDANQPNDFLNGLAGTCWA
jgi:hypothetical protein